MKRVLIGLFILAIVVGVSSAITTEEGTKLTGKHFNLNLIGVKDKTAEMSGSGHVIFVKETGKTNILLSPGDFAVLDKNGTDGEAAFQLPNPDPDCDGTTEYSVFVRALGKPGKSGSLTSGAYILVDPDGIPDSGDEYLALKMSVDVVVMTRNNGQSVFKNVSKELLYVYVDIGDGLKRYPLFDPRLQDYFWEYDNNGLKLVQLRFYEIPTEVPNVADPPA